MMNWPLMALWMAGSEQRTSASCYRCKSVGVYMCVGEGGGRRKREINKQINKAEMNLQELEQGCVIVERGQENLKRGKCSHQFAEEER